MSAYGPALPLPKSIHEHHSRRILDAFETGQGVSQRRLAKDLGIALGLTNLLVKRLVRKGWVRVISINPNRVRYLITPTGLAEKTRMSRAYFEQSVGFYQQTRDRIREQFAMVANSADRAPQPTRIVFYGAGEVAEIGYICLADRELRLVGVIDKSRTKTFFGFPVHRAEDIADLTLNGEPFDHLVVMSFAVTEALKAEVAALGVPPERVVWL